MAEDNITSRFMAMRRRLQSLASRILGSSSEADDALQDFFVKLWSRRELADGELNDAVMTTMMRNQCIDTLRHKARQGIVVDVDELRNVANDEAEATTDALYDDVHYIINANLSDLQRQILSMHDMHGCEYADIATELHMSIDAVRANVSRARNTIRKIYGEHKSVNTKKNDMRL
jgi:RNA polymerase sigma-70 factor (ECF subfamily)